VNKEKELPEGWVRTTLGDIRIDQSKTIEPNKFSEQFFELYSVPSFELKVPEIVLGSAIGSNKQTVETGTVLLCKINPRINRAWVVGHFSDCPKIASTEWIPFLKLHYLNPKYLCYYLSLKTFRDYLASNASGVGGSLMRVNSHTIANYLFPLAPLLEQQRIVSAIEERFTILDAVATALQQNKQKLKLARASVLKHAVEGKLTEKWRVEHPATESGSELLERILAERRMKWEAEQLAKGKDPRKLRCEEPASPDVSELLELPEGWCLVTMNQVVARSEYGTSTKCDYEAMGVPVLRIPNIAAGEIDLSDMKYSIQPLDLTEDSALQAGDILVCRTNGSIGLIGKAALVRRNLEPYHTFASYLLRFRLCETTVLPTWLHLFIGSYQGRFFIESHAASSAGQHNISLTLMHGMLFPLPPLAEQQQIVAEVERRLSIIEQAQVAIETSLKRIERARQSILERAFSGRLVPQDPHDEPASVLLERIQEERGRRVAEGKLRGKNGGVKAARVRKTKEEDFVPQWQLLRDAKQPGSIDGSLGNASADEDGAAERREMGQGEMGKGEVGDLVQMPLLSLWD